MPTLQVDIDGMDRYHSDRDKARPSATRRDLGALLYQKKPLLLELFVVSQHINHHMHVAALNFARF